MWNCLTFKFCLPFGFILMFSYSPQAWVWVRVRAELEVKTIVFLWELLTKPFGLFTAFDLFQSLLLFHSIIFGLFTALYLFQSVLLFHSTIFPFYLFFYYFIGLYLVSCPMQLRSEQIWTSLYTALVHTVLLLCFIIYSCPLDTEGEGSPDFSMITSFSFVNSVSLSRNLTSCCACPPQAMPLNDSMFLRP